VTVDGTSVSPAPRLGARLPFTGRDAELRTLLAKVGEVPSTTVVSGPAGIGKTRLLTELADRAGGTVLYGRGWRGAQNTPYVPWTQVLSAARQVLGAHEISRFRDLAPLLSGRQQPRFVNSESMQHVLGLALGDYLREVASASDNNLVVVIDDLHHGDEPSIALALAIARQRLPLALLTTSRPLNEARARQRHGLTELIAEADALELGALGRDDIESILVAHAVPIDRLDTAVAATSGIPLLLDQWVRTKADGEGLDYEASVSARVAALGTEARDLLRTAALAGDIFDLSVVAEVHDVSVPVALGHIDRAAEDGLVSAIDSSPTRYRFGHETVRETLERAQTAGQRALSHARILDVLLRRRGTAGDVDVSILAAHASEAAFVGEASLAVDLNIEAGDAALRRGAPDAAVSNFERAIDIGAASGSSRRSRLVAELGIARARKAAGDGRATEALIGVLECADTDDDLVDLGIEAALLLPANDGARGLGSDREPFVVRWLEWALDKAGDEPSVMKGRLLLELALQTYTRSTTQGEALVTEADALAETFDDAPLSAMAVCFRHSFRRRPGDMAEVLADIERLEGRIGPTDVETRLAMTGLINATLMRAGRFTEALAEVGSLEEELSPLPPSAQWSIGRWRAAIHHVRGDHLGAEAAGLAAFSLVEHTPLGPVAFDYLAVLLASVMHVRMQHQAIIDVTSAFVDSPGSLAATAAKAGAAAIFAEQGRDAEAQKLLAQIPAAPLEHRDSDEFNWLIDAVVLSQAWVALGDVERCAEYLDSLESYRNEWVVLGSGFLCTGPVALRRAEAAIVAGRLDIAADDLALARNEVTKAGARLFIPPVLCAEADLFIADYDAAAAVRALCEASDVCMELELDEAAAMIAGRAFEVAASDASSSRSQVSRRCLSRQGSIWNIEFGGETGAVGHVKGLLALELLLASPGDQFHALELAAVVDGVTGGLMGEPTGTIREATSPILDARAFAEYRKRVTELQSEIDEASEFRDGERESVARRELDAILEQLEAATGIGGTARLVPGNAERARVRITKSIRFAVGRVGDVVPEAGRHLAASVRTGAFCSYEPDGAAQRWTISPQT